MTLLLNPLKGKTFPVTHHFLVSCSYWTNPFPSSSAVFPLKLNSLWLPLDEPFVVHLFSQISPRFFFSACCFVSASFVPLAGHNSLLQPLLLTKEWHACLAASATRAAPTGRAAVAKVSPLHPHKHLPYVLMYLAIIFKIFLGIFEAWKIYQMRDSTTQKQSWETSEVSPAGSKISVCIIRQLPEMIPGFLQDCWENIRACVGRNTKDHLNEGKINYFSFNTHF